MTDCDDNDMWLDQQQAAEYLRVSRRVLRLATEAGLVPYLELGPGTVRYHKQQLLEAAWRVAEHKENPGPPEA